MLEPAPDEQQPTPQSRLFGALHRPARTQVVVAVLLAIVAYAGVTQVRANQDDDSYAGYREQDLIDVLSGLAGTTRRARSELSRLDRTRAELESSSSAQRAALEQAQQQSETLSILAGLVPVTGPGVRITIKEITGPVDADTVLDMVQELRNAGAEAMQFNGKVRIAAQSFFTDTVGGIVIDGTRLTAPYVVDVIGDPSALSGAMSILEGPRVELQADGAEVYIDELNSLDIDSVRQAVQPVYAQPDDVQPDNAG